MWGLCDLHRRQHSAGVPFGPPRFSSLDRTPEGLKPCRGCGRSLPEHRFTVNAAIKDGLMARCRDCQSSVALQKNYGLTAQQRDQMIASQGGVCAICKKLPPKREGQGGWHVDHDHSCCPTAAKSCGRCVRGILCSPCNRMLGMARDDINTLRSAITYLAGARA